MTLNGGDSATARMSQTRRSGPESALPPTATSRAAFSRFRIAGSCGFRLCLWCGSWLGGRWRGRVANRRVRYHLVRCRLIRCRFVLYLGLAFCRTLCRPLCRRATLGLGGRFVRNRRCISFGGCFSGGLGCRFGSRNLGRGCLGAAGALWLGRGVGFGRRFGDDRRWSIVSSRSSGFRQGRGLGTRAATRALGRFAVVRGGITRGCYGVRRIIARNRINWRCIA